MVTMVLVFVSSSSFCFIVPCLSPVTLSKIPFTAVLTGRNWPTKLPLHGEKHDEVRLPSDAVNWRMGWTMYATVSMDYSMADNHISVVAMVYAISHVAHHFSPLHL